MALLTVIALYDRDLNFFPSGKQFTISAGSQIAGIRSLPTSVSVPGATGYTPTSPLLIIKTTEFGDLYLNQTEDQYLQEVSIQAATKTPEKNYQFTQGTNVGLHSITATELYNSTIDLITGGSQVITTPFTYTSDPVTLKGRIDFAPFFIDFTVPTLVQVLYHNN